jgi:hypothetical protein
LRLLPTHDFISQRNYAHSWIPRRWRAPLLFFSNMLSLKFQVSLCDVRWMWRSNFIKKEIFLLFNEIFSDRKVVMLHLCNWYFFYSRLHCYHEWNFQRFSFSFFPFCFDDKKIPSVIEFYESPTRIRIRRSTSEKKWIFWKSSLLIAASQIICVWKFCVSSIQLLLTSWTSQTNSLTSIHYKKKTFSLSLRLPKPKNNNKIK